MKEELEKVKIIKTESIDVTGMYHGRNGTNDYSRRGLEICTIFDNMNKEIEIVWKEEWTMIAPGILSATVNGAKTIKIHAETCPVRIQFREYDEYVSYDCSDHNSFWQRYYWIRYENGLALEK